MAVRQANRKLMKQFVLFEKIKNQRRHERLPRSFTLRYDLLDDLSKCQASKSALLLDIGGGGIRFLTDEHLDNGSQLVIELEIPGWEIVDGDWIPSSNRLNIGKLQVVGKVVWTTPSSSQVGFYETGLRFTGQLR